MVKDKAHGAISLKSVKGVIALQYCWPQRRIGTRLQAGRADSSREAAVLIRDFEDKFVVEMDQKSEIDGNGKVYD